MQRMVKYKTDYASNFKIGTLYGQYFQFSFLFAAICKKKKEYIVYLPRGSQLCSFEY